MIHPTAYIHPTAVIGPNVTIGAGSYIGPLCVIGYPAEWKGREGEEDQGVYIGDNVRLTGLVTVDSGVEGATVIGNGCYLLKSAHVGHDAKLEENVILSCKAIVGGHTVIGRDSNIGLGAILHQKINIPAFTMIGMGGIVTKKSQLESFNIYAGNPVRLINKNTLLIERFKDEYSRNL